MMPVASHLLTHSKRWPEPRYISGAPSVIDLTPGCLGPAEGFAQAGARIDAAMGFDPVRDCTWKVCILFLVPNKTDDVNQQKKGTISTRQSL